MKAKLNYKNRKTIIIIIATIALLALSVTGIYVFTKGNDSTEAFTDGNNIIEGSSQNGIQEGSHLDEGQTTNPNIDFENEETENILTEETEENDEMTGSTVSTIMPNVPNQEYITERQEEVEKLIYEGFLVGWMPISLSTLIDDIGLNKVEQNLDYTVQKVATLVNGEALVKDENGKVITKVQRGDKVTYVITIENIGNVTLQNVKVVDELIKYEDTIKVLAIGDKKEITVEYIVDETDMDENEEIINVVKATVTDPTNPENKIEKEDDEVVPVNPYITIKGTKTWIDYNNQENTRPDAITVEVLNGETVVDTITVTEEDGWAYTSKELPKYADKNATEEITYTVREVAVEGYTTTYNKNNVVNTINSVPTVTVSGIKTWVDYKNQENTRPFRIIVEVLNGEIVVDTIIVTAENGWRYTSKELPKYANKNATEKINYTVRETKVDSDYIATAGTGKYDIVNTLKIVPKTQITVRKVWADANNQDGNRPSNIKIQLFANGVAQGDAVTLTESNKIQADANVWEYTFKDLDKYNSSNKIINYEVKEVLSNGTPIENNGTNVEYTVTYQKDISKGIITITNSYIPKTINITTTKIWVDNNNEYGDRPSSITIKLYNENKVVNVEPVVSKQGSKWVYTFSNLPKYSAGKLITYTAKELRPDGSIVEHNKEYNSKYLTTYNGNTITNTLMITVSGIKTWDDKNSPVATIPEKITVEVLNGNTVVDTITPVTSANGWKYTSKKLPKYTSNNVAIEYTVREKTVTGYTPDYSDRKVAANGNIIANIKNTLKPFTQYTANVEEISMTTINKNVYIVLDASSSMNATITGTSDVKMEVACDQVASLIRRVFASSTGSKVKLITFNKDTTVNKSRVLGVFVYGTASNATEGEALAKEIEAVKEAPWTKQYGKTKTYGTDMYAALTKLNKEIVNDDNNGTITSAEKEKNIVIFVGDGSPTSPDDNSSYPGNKIDENKISNPNADCPIYNTAREIKKKVSKFYTLGFDLNLSGESYNSEQAKQIIKNIGTEYYDVKNITQFTNAFDSIFKGMNTNRFNRTTQTYNPIITIVANGNVKIGDGITLTSTNKGEKKFKTQKQIDDTNGITYTSKTHTFTIDTRVFTGNISLKYTIE